MFSCEYCEIFKNIYFEDHLKMAAFASGSILNKEFVDISYENVLFGIREDSIWLQIISFLTTIAIWLKNIFSEYSVQYLLLKSTIMENSRHCINFFQLFCNWRIKSSKNFPRNHGVPGLLF